jgi:PAS domain S-box-containing protein
LNGWLIIARWFWLSSVFALIAGGNLIFPLSGGAFSFLLALISFLFFLFLNSLFFWYWRRLGKTKDKEKSGAGLTGLCLVQIVGDFFFLACLVVCAGSNAATIGIFCLIPVIEGAFLFGIPGGVLTGIASAFLISGEAASEYWTYLFYYVWPYDAAVSGEPEEWRWMTALLVQAGIWSLFYIVVGIFVGSGSRLLAQREKQWQMRFEQSRWQDKMRQEKVEELEEDTEEMAKEDKQLKRVNARLSQKIKELEKSEKSLMRAFSDLQEARIQIEEEQNKVTAIVSNFIDPIILIDKKGCLGLINPAARDVFGFTNSHLGQSVSRDNNYSFENFRKLVQKKFQIKAVKSQDIPEATEEVEVEDGGQHLTYKVVTATVNDSRGRYMGHMKIFYNVTREKMIDRMKTEFISIAAHQLRTPLSSIKWVIKMVLSGDAGDLNEEQAELLDKGYKSNERMIGLVNDMLDVSRIEEGRFGYDFAVENFTETLDIIIETLSSQISEKHIKFKVDKPKKLPKVEMDKKKMSLVLQNLLENAVKYTPEYGRIEVILEPGEKFLRVRVKDNGVGIPAEDQAKLFSKFFRANNVIRMQTEGSGLGLFIVKNIIQKHGGDITFTSEEGKGTEFAFTLPFKAPENN